MKRQSVLSLVLKEKGVLGRMTTARNGVGVIRAEKGILRGVMLLTQASAIVVIIIIMICHPGYPMDIN